MAYKNKKKYRLHLKLHLQKFEDAKEVIKIRKSRKEKNNTIAKRKRTNNRPFTYT